MTHAQLRLFTAAAGQRMRRELRDQLINMRAVKYDRNNFNTYLRKLEQ